MTNTYNLKCVKIYCDLCDAVHEEPYDKPMTTIEEVNQAVNETRSKIIYHNGWYRIYVPPGMDLCPECVEKLREGDEETLRKSLKIMVEEVKKERARRDNGQITL